MNAQTTTPEFMFLFRDSHWEKGLSHEQLRQAMEQYMRWVEGLMAQGKIKTGQPLEEPAKLVSGKNGRVVLDGPYAESKEVVGGFWLLDVATIEEAVAIAQQNPLLEHGARIEVRRVAKECQTFRRIREQLALAAA